MAKSELILPPMGEGIIEATIIKWLVNEGDRVEEDQPLLEIATDKVDSEIPSPVNGIISKLIRAEGETAAIGDIIAIIETESGFNETHHEKAEQRTEAAKEKDKEKEEGTYIRETVNSPETDINVTDEKVHDVPRQTPSGIFITPLVRSIAKKENISPGELDKIKGSGESGRITKEDVLNYLKVRADKNVATDTSGHHSYPAGTIPEEQITKPGKPDDRDEKTGIAAETTPEKTGVSPGEGDQVIEMDRMRKLIGQHMVRSKHTSPHVTSFIDADVTELVKWRTTIKDEFKRREKQNITYTPFFIEAAAKALRDYPMINTSVAGTTIILKKSVNIGIAVALPDGNLIAPVIKNADERSLIGLVKALNDLAYRARNNKLQPDEVAGGTFTITNFGTFRNTAGTPIINQPEVAILGTGAIVKKPVVIESDQGDVIAIRQIMTLSLSYDHRVVDGALGGKFLRRIAEYLEAFDTARTI